MTYRWNPKTAGTSIIAASPAITSVKAVPAKRESG
jgi:hypothetical protein